MPLSTPVSRRLVHERRIAIDGFAREDGLIDVEAEIVDTKTRPFVNEDRGIIAPGEPLHMMRMRMTVDRDLVIQACEAVTEYAPFHICPGGAAGFGALAGLRIGRGFLKAANDRVGGVAGCTHLRELIQQMATVAFQTLYSVRKDIGDAAPEAAADSGRLGSPASMIGTCYAFSPDSPVVRRRWPGLAAPAPGSGAASGVPARLRK